MFATIYKNFPRANLVVPKDYIHVQASAYSKLLLIPIEGLKRSEILWLMEFVRQNQLEFEDFWEWNKAKCSSDERKQRYLEYWNTESEMPMIPAKEMDLVLSKYYPNLLDAISLDRVRSMFSIPPPTTTCIDTRKVREYRPDDFKQDIKHSCIVGAMGSGKTAAVAGCIKEHHRVLVLSPRLTLTANLQFRFKEITGFEFDSYTSYTFEEKQNGQLNVPQRLIMSVCSLHYLDPKQPFDVVVMDESETSLATFGTDLYIHRDRSRRFIEENFFHLVEIVRKAKKVYWLDALMKVTTTEFIALADPNASAEIVDIEVPRSSQFYIQHASFGSLIFTLKEKLKNGEKIHYITGNKAGKTGVETVAKIIADEMGWKVGEHILPYTGDRVEEKKALGDTNRVWGDPKVRLVISNSCVTVGVNFSQRQVFDAVFIHWNRVMSPHDVNQATRRCRDVKQSGIHLYLSREFMFPDRISHVNTNGAQWDSYRSIWNNLRTHLAIERAAQHTTSISTDAFKLFAEKSGIVFREDTTQKSFLTQSKHKILEEERNFEMKSKRIRV